MRAPLSFFLKTSVAVAVVASLWPLPPTTVEVHYSSAFYPVWQPLATRASNLTSIALFDVMILVVATAWIVLAARDLVHRPRLGAVVRIAVRTTVWAAALYVTFLASWGLNYRRVPLVDTVQFDATAVSIGHARDLANATVDRLNALYPEAHVVDTAVSADRIDEGLKSAFARVLGELGRPTVFVPGRPKYTLLDPYFRRAGVEGMTDPYFLETLVVSDLLPVERPFVVAHEWSHLAGVANEGEANFMGWLTCLRGGPLDRYSGSVLLYQELAASLPRSERLPIAARLAPGPRADLVAIARRQQQVNPHVSTAGWRVYDQYLKANRVESGTASYAEVVRLVLGVRTTPDGAPITR
jgi:Protein of unknown function (DUF3810)